MDNTKLLDLSGKRAIVTGGAVGIGLGIARRLAAAGAGVVIADIDGGKAEEAATELAAEHNTKITALAVDVSKPEDVMRLTETTTKVLGGIDILVNNAGIYPNKPMMAMEPAEFDRILDVNLRGAYLTTHMTAAQMIKQGKGGRIINITSIDAIHPSMVGLAAYDASKHGLWGFTKNTALELAEHKIWVNAVAPGGIATPGTQTMNMPKEELDKIMEGFLAKIPMHRMGEPDDIGKVVLFLASPMSDYMTGSQIVVDGGVLLS